MSCVAQIDKKRCFEVIFSVGRPVAYLQAKKNRLGGAAFFEQRFGAFTHSLTVFTRLIIKEDDEAVNFGPFNNR